MLAKKLTLGGIAGGFIVFFWGMLSWMILPWHSSSLNQFTDEDLVASALKANAPTAGIYVLPYFAEEKEDATYNATAKELVKEKMRKGPFAFVSILPDGTDPEMSGAMLVSLVGDILAAVIISFLLLQTSNLSYRRKIGFITLVAVCGGVLCHLPNWNWWGFSSGFTLVAMADLAIGWALAGLAMAKII